VTSGAQPRGGYGADDRRLLQTAATRVYAQAVTHGWLPADDARLTGDPELRSAVELLVDLGLLRNDEATGRLHPADPTAVQAQVVVPLGNRGSELLAESARWAEAFADLSQVYRTSPQAAVSPITEIHGLDNINAFIVATVNDSREELLTAQPRDYVADIVALGAEVRTLDEFFRRLIVVDRRVAVVPGSDNHHVAIAIHDRSLIAYLVDVFERAWERAQPFNLTGNQAERNIAADVRAMTVRLLVEGHSDPASAKRLGVSTRTYAGYIAALKDEYGVQTRFQLGYAMRAAGSGPDESAATPQGPEAGG
jgi:hypothetical protein